ncbi:putative ribonuclease H-like domain-containing protein [Tanacetum coccineum]
MKTASTLIETNKALLKDKEAEDVDVHLYILMIGSLMYLTASRPDMMFAVCACARDSPFDLEAFSDSDYDGASLDRKSTIRDETVIKEWEDRMERAATTASSLEAEQDSYDYDPWAMEMEIYLSYIDNEVWKVIQNGNSKKRVTKGKDGVYRVLPPATQEEQFADEKERKARTLYEEANHKFLRSLPPDGTQASSRQDKPSHRSGSYSTYTPSLLPKQHTNALLFLLMKLSFFYSHNADDIAYDCHKIRSLQEDRPKAKSGWKKRQVSFDKRKVNVFKYCHITGHFEGRASLRFKGRVNVNTGHGNVSSVSSAGTHIKSGASSFNTGKQNVSSGSLHVSSGTHIKSGASSFNTGKQHVNSGSLHVSSGTHIKSGASSFNTGKQHVNSGSLHVNSGTQNKSGGSRVNTGKQNVNSGRVHVNTARVTRPVLSNQTSQVNLKSPKKCFSKQRSPVNRPFTKNTAYKSNNYAVKGKMGTAVKTSAGCVWRKTTPHSNTNSGPTPASYVHDHPLKHMEHRGIFDSGCSGHMTGNRAHLEDYQELSKVGSVTFGGSKGSISGKGTIRLGNLVFDDVAFVKELGHFNLFSISQICDKKLNVLFTEKECFVVSSDFKMPDENQVLLKVPRQHNMYTFDMKTVDSSKGYTCLLAKASSNEAKLWHRRLGHLNFKNLNKLVKDNLVRGLPSKSFKNDHTCVACQKGKQHKASCQPQPSAAPTSSQLVPTPTPSHVQIPTPPITSTPPSSQPPPTLIQPVQSTTPPPQPSNIQPSRTSEESEQLRNLLDLVPRLESRVESLEKELSDTKQTLGTAILQLIEKVRTSTNSSSLLLVIQPITQVNTASIPSVQVTTGETERVQGEKGKDPMTEEDAFKPKKDFNKKKGSNILLRDSKVIYMTPIIAAKEHAELKSKSFEEIQVLYERYKKQDQTFVAIGSEEDERAIKKMNEQAADKEKEQKDESVHEEVKEEEGAKKRKEDDDLKMCLHIAPDEDKVIDVEILDHQYPIIEWQSFYLTTKPQFDPTKPLEDDYMNRANFDGKADEGSLFGYSLIEKLLEYSNRTKASDNVGQARKETEHVKDYILLPLLTAGPPFPKIQRVLMIEDPNL